ncbi:MAG: hypothetical protein QW761_00855 [Candidatus Aenigmatarchaeota archaeon]
MNMTIILGVGLAIMSLFVAMIRSEGDIRWGLTAGMGAAMLILIALAWASSAGFV